MPPIPHHATIPAHATYQPCHPHQPMPPMPVPACLTFSPLSPPYLTPYQRSAAQFESSCGVKVISLSGGTGGRRNIFANSRTKGAAGRAFGTIVISCIFVGVCSGRLLPGAGLRVDRLPVIGASSHFFD